MLTKKELEDILKAWPDDEGRSRNPELFESWIERERRYDARIIQNALGRDRILALSERQKSLLDRNLSELLRSKDITQVSDAEILGRYELITEHISPLCLEVAVEDYKRRQKMN